MSAPPRSYLFAPGSSARLVGKVFDAGADAIVLDLEDAVAPADKEVAREQVAAAVASRPEADGHEVWVRVNGIGDAAWRLDVAAVAGKGLTGIRVPKVESLADLDAVDAALTAAESEQALEAGSIAVTATVESAAGVLAAETLARHPRVTTLAFGAADFLADVGAEPDADGLSTLVARSHLVLASRAAGIAAPIAPVYTELDDDEGLRSSSLQARQLGFGGRSCIHPRQLSTVHAVFTPDATAVASARRTIEAFERARGGGAVEGGRFVDAASVRRAQGLLARARALGVEVDG